MNILVVDDNRLLNRLLVTYLRGKGHTATSIPDSTKVTSWLDLNTVDVIIMDVGMPKMDGIELTQVIRQCGKSFSQVPIVFFTGLGYDEGTMERCRIAGGNGYVSKGLGASEVYSKIMMVLQEAAVKATK